MSDLTKSSPPDASFALSKGKLVSKTSGFKSRLNSAKQQAESTDPQTMPNRICLMLDCSGSMDSHEGERYTQTPTKRRIDLLKDAVQNFVSRCNFADTSVAIAAFPSRSDKAMPLTQSASAIHGYTMGLEPSGNTPLYEWVVRCLTDIAMTRGVIVSDGEATDWRDSSEDTFDRSTAEDVKIAGSVLQLYKEQGIPLDCVHISTSTDGEGLLRRIARETGGIFIKFSDVSAFAQAFGYLTPGYRAMLTSGSVDAKQIGAREIK